MAGLRDLAAIPASDVTDLTGPTSWSTEQVDRATASPFTRGFRSAGYAQEAGARMQASLEAAAKGDKAIAAQLRAEAEQLASTASDFSPDVTSYKDVNNVGDAATYLSGGFGQGLRSTIPSLTAGVAAMAVSRGAGLRRLGQTLAGGAASAVPAYQMEKGEAVMNAAADPTIMATKSPQEILDAATVKGAVNAGGEALVPTLLAGKLVGAAAKAARPSLRRAAITTGESVLGEGATEGVQELVGQAAHSYLNPARDKSKDLDALIDSTIIGGVTGGGMGAPVSAVEAARAVAADVRSRAATKLPGAPPAAPASDGSVPLGGPGPEPSGPFDWMREQAGSAMDRARDALRNTTPPMDIVHGGIDKVIDWQRDATDKSYAAVSEALKSDPAAAELSARYEEDPKAHFAEAAGYLTKKHGVDRAVNAVRDLRTMAEDFARGITGGYPGATVEGEATRVEEPKALPKKNEQYDATDRAIFDVFEQNIPKGIARDTDTALAADLMRRFARGQLDPKMGTRVATLLAQTYGDQAPRVALEVGQAMIRSGAAPKVAQQLHKVVQGVLGDDGMRQQMLTKGVDPLISNEARAYFQQSTGRSLGQHELVQVARKLDKVASGEDTHVAPLHDLFGDKLQAAVNMARAAHDAQHQQVSVMNELLNGPTTEQDQGDTALLTKGVEQNAPTVYSFREGPKEKGTTPYDPMADHDLIVKRAESLKQQYPGATVNLVPAAQYAKLEGHELQGKGVVLQVVPPTNADALALDRSAAKKLVQPTAMTRAYQPGDEKRDARYQVRKGKDGRQYTEVRRPGNDEGAMYVALNKADGTPLEVDGKRQYGRVDTGDLLAEMKRRDHREGVTAENGGKGDLQLLLAGITSLATAEGTSIDTSHGITFVGADGKEKRVALKGDKTELPTDLKVGRSTVGEMQKHGTFEAQAFKNEKLATFSALGKDEVAGALSFASKASLATDEGPATPDIVARVKAVGFPPNLRANLTTEQKQALGDGDKWVDFVKSALTGEQRSLYNHFFTEKGYTRLTPEAKAMREIMPELERRAALIEDGETLDPETGLPEERLGDPTLPQDKGEARLNPDAELGVRTRSLATKGGKVATTQEELDRGAAAGNVELHKALPKRSAQQATDRPLTDTEKAAIEAYVAKVLGPRIKVAFEENLGHAGEWDQDANVVRIAVTTGVNGMSIASHEALHGFFSFLGTQNKDVGATLKAAAGGTAVRKQLERLLAGQTAALRQLSDPEERAAYMYQFWVAGELRLGPETEGVFNKVRAFFRKALGILTTDEKAELILQTFHEGSMTEPSVVAKVMHAIHNTEKMPGLRHMMGSALHKASALYVPAYDALKDSGNSEAAKIAELFFTDPTSTTKKQGYLNALPQHRAIWLNKFSTTIEGVSKENLLAARDILQGKTAKAPNGDVASVVNLWHQLRREFFVYMKDAGVNVNERRNYFPRAWDMSKITGDIGGFEEKLLQHHRDEMEAMGEMAFKQAMKAYDTKPDRDTTPKPKREDFTAEVTAKHVVATLSAQNGYVEDDTGKTPLKESAARPGFTPFMAAVNKRSLDFLDMKVFGEYLQEDFVNIVSTYLSQGVRRAEYARRFGNDGERLASMMHATIEQEHEMVQAEGLKGDALVDELSSRSRQYARAIMGMEGTLGYDISPTMRRVNSGLLVYQNLRVLPLALFSSLIDPMGILVRGGTVNDSFEAFKRGIKDLTVGLHSGKQDDDQATKLAELMGTVDNKLMLDALGETYSSVYLYGWAKRLNEKLFAWNGMESWNRSMRIAATQAAIQFIGRHASTPSEHSERWLAELGLTSDDVAFDGDRVKVFAEEGISAAEAAKMRAAVQRWVDSAILRPNAAQRPAWASDPHYALIFHLKQFTYSFHTVILKRVANEWVHGNLTPGMVLASYVPFMLAADVVKGLIQGGGEEPKWKKGWTVGDYTANAVQRAGLLGIGQIAVDAKNMGVSTLGGPTFEQGASAVTDPAWTSAVRALPGNPAYREALL